MENMPIWAYIWVVGSCGREAGKVKWRSREVG